MRNAALVFGGLVVLCGALAAVSAVQRREQALHDSEARQERAMMYELGPQHVLRLPIAAGVDVVRIVARGFSRNRSPGLGMAKLRVTVNGTTGEQTERLQLPLTVREPQSRSEDGEMTAGDRASLNIETSALGAGTLTLELDEVSGADGLLVRFYQRQALDSGNASSRGRELGARARERLARRQGELDWADLEPQARAALLAVRWSKLAALPEADQPLVSHLLTSVLSANPSAAASSEPPEHAEEPAKPSETIDAERVTNTRPLAVEADSAPLLLRLRFAAPPGAVAPAPSCLRVVVEAPGAPQRAFKLVGPRAHLQLPAHGRALLRPEAGELDVALAELDPRAPPRPVRGEEGDATELWRGFVSRRPSNFGDFAADEPRKLWLEPRAPEPGAFEPTLPRVHVVRPRTAATLDHAKLRYVAGSAVIDVDVPASGAVLNLRLFAASATASDVVVLVDDGQPRRRGAGSPRFVTTSRVVRLAGDAGFGILLGDDLEPGQHRISLRYPDSVKVWLHAPWKRRVRPPQPSGWLSAEVAP